VYPCSVARLVRPRILTSLFVGSSVRPETPRNTDEDWNKCWLRIHCRLPRCRKQPTFRSCALIRKCAPREHDRLQSQYSDPGRWVPRIYILWDVWSGNPNGSPRFSASSFARTRAIGLDIEAASCMAFRIFFCLGRFLFVA
jgi:hypothetical protein